jgi:hypothetical protein
MLLVPVTGWATTITFSELPTQPVNGLTFDGVTFTFTEGGVASRAALFGGTGPGTITYVSDPSLTGPADGVLRLDFVVPTPILQFGLALDCFGCVLTPGATVLLYDPSLTLVGSFPVNTLPLISYSEAEFNYTGSTVQRAVISFDSIDANNFAFDNLTFATPEPSSFALVATATALAGILILGLWLRQ